MRSTLALCLLLTAALAGTAQVRAADDTASPAVHRTHSASLLAQQARARARTQARQAAAGFKRGAREFGSAARRDTRQARAVIAERARQAGRAVRQGTRRLGTAIHQDAQQMRQSLADRQAYTGSGTR